MKDGLKRTGGRTQQHPKTRARPSQREGSGAATQPVMLGESEGNKAERDS